MIARSGPVRPLRPGSLRVAPAGPADVALRLLLQHSDWWDRLAPDDQQLLHELDPPYGEVVRRLETQLMERGPMPRPPLNDALAGQPWAEQARAWVRAGPGDESHGFDELQRCLGLLWQTLFRPEADAIVSASPRARGAASLPRDPGPDCRLQGGADAAAGRVSHGPGRAELARSPVYCDPCRDGKRDGSTSGPRPPSTRASTVTLTRNCCIHQRPRHLACDDARTGPRTPVRAVCPTRHARVAAAAPPAPRARLPARPRAGMGAPTCPSAPPRNRMTAKKPAATAAKPRVTAAAPKAAAKPEAKAKAKPAKAAKAEPKAVDEKAEKAKPLRIKVSRAKERALMREFGLEETTLSEEESTKRSQELKTLIKMSKTRGFLTHQEINDHLHEKLINQEVLEAIISMLNDLGIAVYEQAPDAATLLVAGGGAATATEDEAEVAAEAALPKATGDATLPAYLCTADDAPERVREAAAAGFVGLWPKPVDLATVIAELKRGSAGAAGS